MVVKNFSIKNNGVEVILTIGNDSFSMSKMCAYDMSNQLFDEAVKIDFHYDEYYKEKEVR